MQTFAFVLSFLPCCILFGMRSIHLFLHFKVFIFLFLYFLMLVSVTVRPNGGPSISVAPDCTDKLVAAAEYFVQACNHIKPKGLVVVSSM